MTKRQTVLVDLIQPCKVFADIGCDHGVMTQAVLRLGKAQKVYATDISKPSLSKTEKLIAGEFDSSVTLLCCDGFSLIPEIVDQALIAGMGGEEICHVLSDCKHLPNRLILQPMKNSEKLRRLLFDFGYGITRDFTFYDGDKFYDVIVAEKSAKVSEYSPVEYAFGRDNVKDKSADFLRFAKSKLAVIQTAFEKASDDSEKEKLLSELRLLREIINENI
ncbi:MAG: SAM-dependent methyltransferase [Clostridia bacterium]|nr:SAM-dependent methyltransferase [Clostridia bacterium]